MYFITDKDPNYSIKGSRDPLGFQVIWQSAGRKLIPNLSTVSNNIIDFQILSLAYIIKNEFKISDNDFESFFIKFEQIMAYTRHEKNKSEGFNGVEKVRKIMSSNGKFKISMNEQILSNQKAYGIWGKYNRPFTDMRIIQNNFYEKTFKDKLNSNEFLSKKIKSIITKNELEVKQSDLENFTSVIEKPENEEKELFVDTILQDTCNQEILTIVNQNQDWNNLSFYQLLDFFINKSSNEKFLSIIKYIIQVEKTICPLNRVFRYLQTQSFWNIKEIEQDEFIENCKVKNIINDGFDETLKALASLHQLSNYELVKGLVKRNETICGLRNSSSWIEFTETGIEVNHFEGAIANKDFNPEINNDNTYFLGSYFSLYNQLN